jgi:hypothetical protein
MHDVRPLATEQPVEFPGCECVFEGYFATHLRDQNRLNAMFGGEIAHVFFAVRHSSGDK